jgi:prevent-host-death family protein
MTEIVNMHQAKSSLSRLVERALAGEEILIARNGEPLVKLVPVAQERKPRVPGRYKGQIWIAPGCFEPMSEEELDLWENMGLLGAAPDRQPCIFLLVAGIASAR